MWPVGNSCSINDGVARKLAGQVPEPVREHYVVVEGKRFPLKQVMTLVTGLDRADFTSHQARRILSRLGFTVARRSGPPARQPRARAARGPHGGRGDERPRRWAA